MLHILVFLISLSTFAAPAPKLKPKAKARRPAQVDQKPAPAAPAKTDALTPAAPTPPAPAPAPAPTPAASTPAPPPPAAPAAPPEPDAPFLDSFPGLKQYVYVEPPSGFYLGFGLSPIGILKDRTTFGVDFFQLHYLTHRWDYQVLNASVGFTRAESAAYQSTNFIFSTSLNVRLGETFEIGPLIGWEAVNFPNLSAFLYKAPYRTQDDPFSSRGLIYGINIAQTFSWRRYLIQLSEIGYNETYSNEKSPDGWLYIYNDPNVRNQTSLIAPRWVMLLKVSLLF